jgi:hypothetical protein
MTRKKTYKVTIRKPSGDTRTRLIIAASEAVAGLVALRKERGRAPLAIDRIYGKFQVDCIRIDPEALLDRTRRPRRAVRSIQPSPGR